MSTSLNGAIVLVTGANGGLGEEFVAQSLQRGAARVYATARSTREWNDPRVVALHLDVLDEQSIADAAAAASDTTVVINNAGISRPGALSTQPIAEIRQLFDANFFGALGVAQAFAPVLGANGGGVLLNVHSALSWLATGGAYSATKAALWSATNTLRLELAPQGTLVTGLHLGYTATPMTAGIDAPMNDAADVVRTALDGIEAGEYEILADQASVSVKAALSGSIEAMYPQLARASA
jgi:NAD(P)-dependent dehydrogenase (short-subunit alcohol dehydrogenase family)